MSKLLVDEISDADGTGPVTVTDGLNVSSGAVFNEAGLDVDFRVESDTNPYMLFVDASLNAVGINESTPEYTLDVGGVDSGSFVAARLHNKDTTTGSGVALNLQNSAFGGVNEGEIRYTNNGGNNNNNMSFHGEISGVNGLVQLGAFEGGGGQWVTQRGAVFNESGINSDFRVESDGNTHMLFVDAGNNKVGINTEYPGETLHVQGKIRLFDGGYPYLDIGTSTSNYFRLIHDNPTDQFYIGKNSNKSLVIDGSHNVIINEGGIDTNFRVESDTNTHALFVDAGANRVSVAGRFAVDESDGGVTAYRSYQMVTGETTANASNVYKGIVDVGVTGILDVKIIAVESFSQVGSWHGSIAIAYGGGNTSLISERNQGGNITDITAQYNNSGSVIEARVTYTGAAPTLYWNVSGMSSDAMVNLA